MKLVDRRSIYAGLLGLVLAFFLSSSMSSAAELPPYESDPTLSLIGNCTTIAADPVPDPSCPYSAPPAGPTGQFLEPRAIAIDLSGNQYVASFAGGDDAKGRVDVFDGEGKFITEFAAPDIQTAAVDSKGNFYAFRNDGDVVRYSPSGSYDPEAGDIEYGNPAVLVASGSFIGSVAVDTDPAHIDQVFVARPDEIVRYKSASDAEPNGVIESVKPAGLGSWPEAMAIDSQRRRIYVSSCKKENEECGIKVLNSDSLGEELEEIDGSTTPGGKFAIFSGLLPVAVDEGTGDFFIVEAAARRIYRFSESYEFLSQQEFSEIQNGAMQIAVSNGTRSLAAEPCDYPTKPAPSAGDACNRHYLYVPVFKGKGRLAAFHPAGQTAPVIEEVSTPGIGETEAELGARIFPGGAKTTYHFELTTQANYEANEWTGATSLGEGTISAESLAKEVSAFAIGLTPGETYRFRVVAENELGPADEEGQNEAVFTTYEDATITSPCPNDPLRVGPSALLPDCRAYELVTPADTNGRPPKGTGFLGSTFATLQASPAGDAVSFKIEGGSLPGSSGVGSFEGDPYVSKRTATGWSTKLAGPNGSEATVSAPASFSPDQGYQFWRAREEGSLVVPGNQYTELLYYPDGHSELIGRGSEGSEPVSIGKLITKNATHIIFQTFNLAPNDALKLEPDAPPTGTEAVYDRTIGPAGEEQTHTVSLLPGDLTPAAGKNANYLGASKDGEGIAFTVGANPLGLGGTTYLRLHNETTFQIGEGEVEFAGASEGGDRAFYVEGGDLRAFDTSSEEVIDFSTTGDATPVNVSDDGSRAYFASPSVLGGANPQGDEAQAGEQNLYLSEDGAISFVATVTDRDVEGEPEPLGTAPHDGLGLWTEEVGDQVARDPSRTNPDGSVLLFQSRAEITGYPESAFPQIYRYDTSGELQCISCIPTGRPATGGAALESYTFDSFSPQPFSPAGYVPNQNPQGTRVFFDSTEALVSTDSDKVTDVYEWEATGVGSCKQAQGCLYLISSGTSERDNFLYGHSTSGDDVFFTTGDQLTGWDTSEGALSIYDAKVGGGFPEPANELPCTGCQPNISPAPNLPTPAAPAPSADDQVKPKPKTCPKGKRKVKQNGKVRCVKKHKKGKGGKAKKRAGANRGAGK